MTPDPRLLLRADCASCEGLCCIVPAFSVSSDFAIDKPSHTACPNLGADHGCTIHAELPQRGFRGCTVYECFGAGQRVVQEQHAGREEMYAAFEVVERMHELLWYLADLLARPASRPLRDELEGLRDAVEAAAAAPVGVEAEVLQRRADPLLGEASRLVRRAGGDLGEDLRGHDLAGRDLRGRDLVAADLRGSLLIGADLRDVDLTEADLLGADLRGSDVRGADLSTTLFLTQLQVNAARGSSDTLLPEVVTRPGHWVRSAHG